MKAKLTIRKFLFVTLWLCIGGGMFTLLLAAISKKNHGQCSDYRFMLKGTSGVYFIDEKEADQILVKAAGGIIKGRSIASFDLHQLEQSLKQNVWISNALLYFDNQDVLHIILTEKDPVARIFTSAGSSYYIDSVGTRMPLSDKLSAKVPVFTDFPDRKALTSNDSSLLNNVKITAQFIKNDSFWNAQVAQIAITPEGDFEMIPVIGNHIVRLGDGSDIEQKFKRLFIFYKQVLSKTGFDKYKMIDVQYKGQVVVSKQVGNLKVDSIQLRKNVEELLRQSRENQEDTIRMAKPLAEKTNDGINITTVRKDSVGSSATGINIIAVDGKPKPYNPNPVKTTSVSNAGKKHSERTKAIKTKKIPKAIMIPKKPADEKSSEYN